jgi:hypothetical protein
MTTADTHLHPFSAGEVALAGANYESQEWLTRELHSAAQMSGTTPERLAELLEITVDEATSWISGDFDLTMSELRHLATALDCHVTYKVDPLVNRLPEWLDSLSGAGWQQYDQQWVPERLNP